MRTVATPISALFFSLACGGAMRSTSMVELTPAQQAEHIGASTETEVADEDSDSDEILDVQTMDINDDGLHDIFLIYRVEDQETLLIRREVDLNWDGLVDVRSWLEPDGSLSREEMDGDFDGWVDWIDHYENGERVRSEIDTDYDHSLDLVLYFENGTEVVRRMRDSNFDGILNRIESSTCIEIDEDGDGVHEIRIPATSETSCPE